jgi:hypothetical protein
LAWLVWVLIHIQFLAEGSLWFSVCFFQWAGRTSVQSAVVLNALNRKSPTSGQHHV